MLMAVGQVWVSSKTRKNNGSGAVKTCHLWANNTIEVPARNQSISLNNSTCQSTHPTARHIWPAGNIFKVCVAGTALLHCMWLNSMAQFAAQAMPHAACSTRSDSSVTVTQITEWLVKQVLSTAQVQACCLLVHCKQ